MLRRSIVWKQMQNKGPARPGPMLYGWGRTEQKRRLEYETVESKYHKREFNKNWDLAGVEQRYTDFMVVRTYFSLGTRWGTWVYNMLQFYVLAMLPVFIFMHTFHKNVEWYDERIRLASWW
ncbi:hypothetical protein C3747_62g682c [Trypanosoma cruzi]|uniref:Uncharacterized protein n=3 Tax=Trypanosoma cruzi TaxID=5693 RepID=Q4DEQ9_TRYCC|nr:uncharacterized protein Tc00.1047053506295.70 [Trypanosoma cruzi]ESS67652.1 hypothetical protein TCDM_14305 [Trypanosoma cruzi Dm28c]PBJ69504.1 hypothetical protein BCY84_19577 [Trypanosoma cruzi cruzi]EAN91006.1 hypothetical protein, conserved [Trypanosoma cruzi]KAF8279986.1 hypothetical protein TcBrA4_0098010 [Trypanosoma cruzi]PWU89980.1 hypothetical protein C4B63_54g906c [Trypanosoma cruzi]|eukprot:XP_812857.1 hypothetical protein [Trypanosoma cruzi strain CL Brener]